MDPLEAIKRAQATRLVRKDGKEVELELAPALEAAEIERVAAEAGVPLPRELRILLEQTAGIDGGPLQAIDFTGRSFSFGAPETLLWALPIAGDGFGNFWILDLTPDDVETAPVFFASHDPPVILYQSPDIGRFLDEAFRMLVPPHASAVDDVHEDRLFNVWRDNPGTLDHPAALASDEPLRAFAAELDERFTFVDLRSCPVGMGFSWGRYGPRTELRRHGHERLFAYAPFEKPPGLL
ncbi:MAG TPA: SMI1/KNR4 family protein, partial [Gaiellaceae bacterium]|nr:SMI1/KNR4 family protein [Gaiellaceae bacterium]